MTSKTVLRLLPVAAMLLLGACARMTGADAGIGGRGAEPDAGEKVHDVVLRFPSDRYPETAAHIEDAIAAGESAVCTINRNEAEENREASLEGVPTRKGYDRDEWPMAMCDEGGAGADIAYIDPSDNRGAGAWVGNRLEDWPDGTRVLFVVE